MRKYTTIVVALALLVSSLSLAKTLGQSASNCQQIEKVKGAISLVLHESLNVLGKKGTAGYAYYHLHPSELAAAKSQTRQDIASFKPLPCT